MYQRAILATQNAPPAKFTPLCERKEYNADGATRLNIP